MISSQGYLALVQLDNSSLDVQASIHAWVDSKIKVILFFYTFKTPIHDLVPGVVLAYVHHLQRLEIDLVGGFGQIYEDIGMFLIDEDWVLGDVGSLDF